MIIRSPDGTMTRIDPSSGMDHVFKCLNGKVIDSVIIDFDDMRMMADGSRCQELLSEIYVRMAGAKT